MYPWAKVPCGLKPLHNSLYFVSYVPIVLILLSPIIHCTAARAYFVIVCCYLFYFFHEPASVFCSVTTANVSPSVLLSRGAHSAQPALRGLQAVCRGQGSGLLSKRRRVLHHWNGGRGSQTLQVSLIAFFFLLLFLYFSSDTNVSVTHWSHPAANLEVNFIHPASLFLFFPFFESIDVCVCVCCPLALAVWFFFCHLNWSAHLIFVSRHCIWGSDKLRPRHTLQKRKQNSKEICLSQRF